MYISVLHYMRGTSFLSSQKICWEVLSSFFRSYFMEGNKAEDESSLGETPVDTVRDEKLLLHFHLNYLL